MKLLAGALLVAGCSTSRPPEVAAGCNPLIGDDCLTPFPSAFYELADPATATGVRLSIDDAVLPLPRGGVRLSAAPLELHDGASPAMPLVAYFAAGIDAAQLPGQDALASTLSPSAPVQIIDLATGARVPLFAELDANALPGQRRALLVHPAVRLAAATRYAVALVGVRDGSGAPLDVVPFAALRDGSPLSRSLAPFAARYEELFAALARAGVPRDALSFAWDFTTASDADLTGHLERMRDEALALVDTLGWTIEATTDSPADPHRLREVVGTFEVPSFLSDDSLTPSLLVDATGAPALRGTLGTARFVVAIPSCAATATAPLPVMIYGHGLFGTAREELETPYQKQLAEYLCMVQVATDWIGLASEDVPTLANVVLPDFNQLHVITDRLQQAHVNAQVLTRLFARRMTADPALRVNGAPVTDGAQLYYYGISDGGIQGATYMALSPDVTRGVLNVPGCSWSTMIFRSVNFSALQSTLQLVMPDPLDQQIVIAASQALFDHTDPASFATHLGGKRILIQESVGDAQVPNFTTRVLARTIGLAALPLAQPVFGIAERAGPLASAYTQWDVMAAPLPPLANVPPSEDNVAHEAIRRLVDLEAQLAAFLTPTGMAIDTCGGPCACDYAAGNCAMAPGTWPP